MASIKTIKYFLTSDLQPVSTLQAVGVARIVIDKPVIGAARVNSMFIF